MESYFLDTDKKNTLGPTKMEADFWILYRFESSRPSKAILILFGK